MSDTYTSFSYKEEGIAMRFKKFAAVFLTAALTLSLGACQDKKKEGDTETTTATTTDSNLATEDATESTAAESKSDVEQLHDGDEVVNIDFEDGDVDSFCEYMNGGKFKLSNEENQLVASIESCGGLDYANQAFWDGFKLVEGTVYTYSFDISSDITRKVEYRLQINSGDYHAYCSEKIDVGPEVLHFSTDFTMAEDSDPAPRIVFNMGKMEDMVEDPGPHKVYIDNIKLVVKDASNSIEMQGLPEYSRVNINQIGYKPEDEKIVFIKDQHNKVVYDVYNIDKDEVVMSGEAGDAHFDSETGDFVRQGDFSELETEGRYKIVAHIGDEKAESYEFKISNDIYNDVYKDLIKMLYKQRCGIKTDPNITGEKFSHDVCHDKVAKVYAEEEALDVSGGWHDAGDYGRYVVPGAKTVQDLLLSYELFGIDDDDMGIPESNNNIPDILDEAKYELDWMLKMQDKRTGGVYHKVTCAVFPETVIPEEETDDLIISPISAAATGDFAAVMAKASVIYKDYDPDFSAKAKEAAILAWKYLETTGDTKGFLNPSDIVTGEYKDAVTQDEIFFAAVELYIAGYDEIGPKIKDYYNFQVKNGLGWADIGTYAMYDLVRSDVSGLDDLKEELKQSMVKRANDLKERSNSDAYYNALQTDYPWGSNMVVACNGILYYMVYDLTDESEYKELAKRQMDYLLGANNLGYCFVTGYGTLSPKHPHHRPSQVAKEAMSGMLVGGPDSGLEDSYAKAVLFGQPAAMCYADNEQTYSTNEVAIYWNSSFILLMSAFR